MSKSDDNTNELESYGVWVKNSTGNNEATENPADTSDELNLDDGGLDLPDFDDSDFSDMFKDQPQDSAADALDDFGSEDDTTLSTDELANITDGFEVEQVDAPAEGDELDLGDFDIPDSPEAEVSDAPDFSETIEDTETAESDEEVEVSGDDEEISLDDFMDGGFSDESVAAGNNGYEPGAEPSSDTEELSLDDFMDGDSFDTASETKETEVIEDEAPLDMDINFDDSADSVETEDNVSLELSTDDDDSDYETEETEQVETEEVSMDDFGSGFTAEESSVPEVHDSSSDNINTEEVDLSDFGIDANAEETPIVQDVEEAKNKEKIVDYDLSVGDENTATAPVVNEIKSEASDSVEEIEEVLPVSEAKPAENSTAVDNSLLQQIVSELSNLKDEMNKLKTNLEEIKTQEGSGIAGTAIAAGAAGAIAGAAAAAMTSNDDIDPEKAEEDKGGFFSDDDEDDTIALSFDELDNIMNTAEFSDTVEIDSSNTEAEADAGIEEIAENSNDTVIDESVISTEVEAADTSETVENEIENAISDEKDTSLDDINFDEDQTDNFDFSSEEKLEEPEIDEFIPDGNDELYENEELPDEISIPKEDDLLVESNSSDFMDSVKETTEEEEEASAEFISEDETLDEENIDLPSELPEGLASEADDDIPTVDKLLGDEETEASDIELDETVVEEEPVLDEQSVTEEVSSDTSFAEVDNLDNTLSESNLAYLDKENADSVSDTAANADLKQDIKSVLLYMDQLLENLPEDKIIEFAKSDEFVTYKKLLNDLGLS